MAAVSWMPRIADAWRRYRFARKGRWGHVLASVLFSGLGQHAAGCRIRAFVWAYSPALLLAAFLVTQASGFLFASLFLGLFSGAFLWLLPFSLLGWIPPLHSPVFWFGALMKILCAADARMVKSKNPISGISKRAILLYALPQMAAPLVFGALFFVAPVSGVHAFDGLPGDVLAGRRGLDGLPAQGEAVLVRQGDSFLVMRVAALPGETVELDVDEHGNVHCQVSGREPEVWRESVEFCAWMKDDGFFLSCRVRVISRDGAEWRIAVPEDASVLQVVPRHFLFQLKKNELFLLSDLRNVVVEPAWLRVSAADVTGRPRLVLWSASSSRGIHWHRIGRENE